MKYFLFLITVTVFSFSNLQGENAVSIKLSTTVDTLKKECHLNVEFINNSKKTICVGDLKNHINFDDYPFILVNYANPIEARYSTYLSYFESNKGNERDTFELTIPNVNLNQNIQITSIGDSVNFAEKYWLLSEVIGTHHFLLDSIYNFVPFPPKKGNLTSTDALDPELYNEIKSQKLNLDYDEEYFLSNTIRIPPQKSNVVKIDISWLYLEKGVFRILYYHNSKREVRTNKIIKYFNKVNYTLFEGEVADMITITSKGNLIKEPLKKE